MCTVYRVLLNDKNLIREHLLKYKTTCYSTLASHSKRFLGLKNAYSVFSFAHWAEIMQENWVIRTVSNWLNILKNNKSIQCKYLIKPPNLQPQRITLTQFCFQIVLYFVFIDRRRIKSFTLFYVFNTAESSILRISGINTA